MNPRSNEHLEGEARISHFTAANNQQVVKVVTTTGVTCYVAASIPLRSLGALKQKPDASIAARQAARPGK